MDSSDNTLNVDDIQTMSMTAIVNLYNNGYKLNSLSDIGIKKLDIDVTTWLNNTTCLGTTSNQICFKNEYPIIVAGVIGLVLLLRK